jgi:hypothetical protein
MATLGALIGIEFQDGVAPDSFHFLPSLSQNPANITQREALIHNTMENRWAVRNGDWLYINDSTGQHSMMPKSFSKLRGYVTDTTSGLLINLAKDPGQRINQYELHPDLVATMDKLISDNASKAPGLWQQVKIDFEPPRFDVAGKKVKNAKFNQVYLNGVLVHENLEVTGPTRSALFEDEKLLGPLMIQGDNGPVAIRNIKYKHYGDPVPDIKDLKFDYHEGKFQSNEGFLGSTPNESGQLNIITWDLGHGVLDFAYVYTGNLEIPKSGDYTFSLAAFGKTSLYLKGENLLDDHPISQ